MGQFEQLDQLLETQDGMLRTAQVVSAGISKPVFYDYVHSRELERVAHGIYLSKDAWVDAMYLLHLRCPQAVFSHETALFFHDLTDREPLAYSVTVKTGYNPTRLKDEGVQVFTIALSCKISNAESHNKDHFGGLCYWYYLMPRHLLFCRLYFERFFCGLV